MAGSLKTFTYTADDGEEFALLADESNIEAVNDVNTAPITATVKYKLPSNLSPRSATYQSADGLIRRKVVVLNAAALAALGPGSSFTDQSSATAVFLRRLDGENISLPSLSDTGLLDSDAD